MSSGNQSKNKDAGKIKNGTNCPTKISSVRCVRCGGLKKADDMVFSGSTHNYCVDCRTRIAEREKT